MKNSNDSGVFRNLLRSILPIEFGVLACCAAALSLKFSVGIRYSMTEILVGAHIFMYSLAMFWWLFSDSENQKELEGKDADSGR